MSIVHQLEGCGWQIQEVKGQRSPDAEPEVVGRTIVVTHPQSDQIWVIPLPLNVAEDMGGQLQGEPPRKHVELPAGITPEIAAQMRNGHG